ncbi:hypothetical protein HPDFL43_15917 [Hoeflea phototrophica DFL-43]|jgi:uncharacterized membrane protein|uniref:Integral membrane protein n=1 Tax=Hoeflea phototrophica (strain DSM 17068 / NCIMB 14078 / DFL-43) TaxID=411684 RepID=A9D1U5_HOEPD|nr:hypothetical protein [Hoeflea phototrophica]EDQ34499.1 hypothetical protein HPDFL43_15917 [Hoeflea phototrophica DFL-43]
MIRTAQAAAIALAALLPLSATAAFAESAESQAALCTETPAKAAKAGVDCVATSSVDTGKAVDARNYPSGPVSFANGVVY